MYEEHRNTTVHFGAMSIFVVNAQLPIKQVIIWGHKLHSHTHSYVHEGFYRAFLHLGYSVFWFDNNDDISEVDFHESLLLPKGKLMKKCHCVMIVFISYIIVLLFDIAHSMIKVDA